MRVLVTGAGGMLGHELVDTFGDHEVTGTTHAELDVTDRAAVIECFDALRPDVVLHGAAWTAVDACEADPDRAWAVNALGTRHITEAARRHRTRVVYFSTDYVFDGTKDSPYVEWDEPAPRSVYGRSKLAGERECDDDATILRISWVCGFHGANMVKTILRLAAEHPTLSFVDDQIGHPTFAADAAAMTRRLVEDHRTGLFHVTNQGAVSWFEFARAVLDAAGQDPRRVEPIATHDLRPARPAPRPANSVLDNAALRLSGVDLLPDFRVPLATVVERLQAG